METAGDEAAEAARGRRVLVRVHGQGVEAAAEIEDLLPGDPGAAQVEHGPGPKVHGVQHSTHRRPGVRPRRA